MNKLNLQKGGETTMKKRTVQRLLAAALTLTMLGGCLGGCGKKENKEGEDGKITITVQTWNPGEGEMMDQIIAEFEKENPDIKINNVYLPYSDHMEKLKIDLASGQAADIYGMQTGAPLKEFRDFEMDLTDYADKTWGDGWEEQYLDFCNDQLDEDGKYYAMPLGMSYAGFAWADVNFLKKYGLEVPGSLDELKKCAEVLRQNNEFPLAIGAKEAWINIDTWMSIANDINAEKLYSAIEGETSFTDEELVQSFQIWQSLFQDGVFQDGALGVSVYNDIADMFREEGSIAMELDGSWVCGEYLNPDPDRQKIFNSEDSDHRAFLIDWNNDGKTCPVTATVDVSLCINKNSRHPDEAWKFIDFMLNEGQDIMINDYLGFFPVKKDMELEVKGMSENGMSNLEFIQKEANDNIAGYREMAYPELKQAIGDNLATLALGDITPEKAAEAVEAASKSQER